MKKKVIILAVVISIILGKSLANGADIEVVLDDASGASAFSVKDSGSVEGAHIDSDGNMVIKGGLRLDASGVENTTAENLIVDGSVGIGDTSPASALTVGNGDLFQVNSSGDVVKLKNVDYTWPVSQGAGSTVLTNNGSGTLSWSAIGALSSTALSGITAAAGANTIGSSDYAQVWNWALTTADKAGFTFGETTASIATGTPSILKASTLASSTAIPLYLYNLGGGLSFRVDDEASDTTPFVIDTSGNVGIGTTSPTDKLTIGGTGQQAISRDVINGSLSIRGGTSEATGAYFQVTGFDYVDSPGKGSAEIVIRNYGTGNETENSKFALWSSDGISVWEPRFVLLGSSGNVGIGTTNPGGGTGSSVLSLANSSAAPTALANTTHLYSSAGEGYWMDAAGNATLQTPHDPVTGEWIFYSKNIKTGRVVRVDMEKLVKAVEQITGKKFMFESLE